MKVRLSKNKAVCLAVRFPMQASRKRMGTGYGAGPTTDLWQESPTFQQHTPREWLKDGLALIGETLATPVALVFLLSLGVAVFALTVAMVPYLLSLPFRLFVNPELLGSLQDTASLVIAVSMVVVFLFAPSIRASQVHR